MPRSDDETDRLIREALEQEDAGAFREADPTMTSLLMATFRGTHRRFAMLGVVLNILLFVGGVAGAVHLFRANDALSVSRWGAVTLLCFGLVVAVKVWYWLEMVRLAITRDLKRLELRMVQMEEAMQASRHDSG